MKKARLILIVLSLSILCGCGAADSNVTAGSTNTQKMIEVGAPTSLQASVDGEYAYILWSNGDNAIGYEYDYGAGVKKTKDKGVQLTGLAPGIAVSIRVRAYNNTEGTPVYSDWKTLNITMPEIDLNNLSMYSAGAISRTKFEQWAAITDPQYEKAENDEYYIYTLKFRDKENEGLWNMIKRGGAAAWSSFWNGYADTVENEVADGENILKGILANRGVKNYLEDVDDSATAEGAWRAVKAAWSAMRIDANLVYVYYFPKDSEYKSAVFFERHCLKKHHENYGKQMAEKYETVTINGQDFYTYSAVDCGRRINFAVGTEKIQGVDRWVTYAYSEYLHFE